MREGPEVASNWLIGGILLGLIVQVGMCLAPVRVTLRWKAHITGRGYLLALARVSYLPLHATLRAGLRGSLLGGQGRTPLTLAGRLRTQLALGPFRATPGVLQRRLGLSWPGTSRLRPRAPAGRRGAPPARPAGRAWSQAAARAFVDGLKGRVRASRVAASFRAGAPDAMAAALTAAAVHAAASNAVVRLLRLALLESPRPAIVVRPAFGHPAHVAARGEITLRVAAFWVSLALARAVAAAAAGAMRGSARGAHRARAQRAAA